MATRNIVKVGDDILRKKSRPVEKFDKRLWQLLDDMKETMYLANGVGLAAVQVGVLRRVVVLDCSQDRTDYLELINPEIIDTEGEQREQEGCLSLPGECGITLRPAVVRVKAQDRNGNWCLYKGEGLKARCFCHEIDHLDGILFTDREIKDVAEIQNETGSGQ
jgi:peptide deformylase